MTTAAPTLIRVFRSNRTSPESGEVHDEAHHDRARHRPRRPILLAGCATYTGQTNDPNDPNHTRTGALIGAGIGAVAGLLSGGDAVERRQRALVGAGVGGLAGAGIGAYQDRQEAALRSSLAGSGVDVVRQGDNITLNMPGNITFAFNSSNLQPQFYPVLDNVASTLNQYNQTVIEVAGHTDNVGSDAYNQQLSCSAPTRSPPTWAARASCSSG